MVKGKWIVGRVDGVVAKLKELALRNVFLDNALNVRLRICLDAAEPPLPLVVARKTYIQPFECLKVDTTWKIIVINIVCLSNQFTQQNLRSCVARVSVRGRYSNGACLFRVPR